MSATWYTAGRGTCAAEHLLGVHSAVWLLPAAGASPAAARADRFRGGGAGHGGHPAVHAGGPGRVRVLTLLGAAMLITGLLQPLLQKIPAWAGLVVSLLMFAATYHTQGWLLAAGPVADIAAGCLVLPTSSRRSSAFPAGLFSTITFRCCPGCFCSGRVLPAFLQWGGPAWSRCAGRSVRRWAGWADIRWDLSAASAGDLWGIAASVPCF